MKETGDPLLENVALDGDGQPATGSKAALDGTILPFNGPKGSRLATAVEVLVGAAMGNDVTGTSYTEGPRTKGDLFVATDRGDRCDDFAAEARPSSGD